MKLRFLGPDHRHANDRQRGGREDQKDGRSDDELEKSNASFEALESLVYAAQRQRFLVTGKRLRHRTRDSIGQKAHPFRITQFPCRVNEVGKASVPYWQARFRLSRPIVVFPEVQHSLCYHAVSPSKRLLSLPHRRSVWAASSASC